MWLPKIEELQVYFNKKYIIVEKKGKEILRETKRLAWKEI